MPITQVKLELGRVCGTPGAIQAFPDIFLSECLTRHIAGDWGDLDAEDRQSNDEAIAFTGEDAGRVLSAYHYNGQKLWIITEWDRSVTTCLLPEEY